MTLEGCESPQPRKRGGTWVLTSHPLKQEGAQSPSLELQVCLLLHHEAGGTMMWWQEAGAECICPAPPPQVKLLQGPTLPPSLENSPSPCSHCLVRIPVIPGEAIHTHRPLQDSQTKASEPLALTHKPPRGRLRPPARAPSHPSNLRGTNFLQILGERRARTT